MATEEIGLYGLAVMGQNLALNFASRGYRVIVGNRTQQTTEHFIVENGQEYDLSPANDPADLVAHLERPRRIVLMVKAGTAVDDVLSALLKELQAGDVVIDGGNSHWRDTGRRVLLAKERGVHFVGAGISGGEEGARYGPSIMPGGDEVAWDVVKGPLTSIAAQAEGEPCCEWIGPDGAGHFVKMIHNGIEYGDMQVIAEAYHLLRASGRSVSEAADVFRKWNEGPLNSYLIEITATILEKVDQDGEPLIEKILDAAAQKGTGRWAIDAALEFGEPATVIADAVLARSLSALKDDRLAASRVLAGPREVGSLSEADVEQALLAAKVVCYSQGFMLIRAASEELGWTLNPAEIAPLWRAGCIIRAALLTDITTAFRSEPTLPNLLLDSHFVAVVAEAQEAWRRVVSIGVGSGIPLPALTSAISFYDGFRSERLPANLIQAQRDFFGAHTYERTDHPRGNWFHTDWKAGMEKERRS